MQSRERSLTARRPTRIALLTVLMLVAAACGSTQQSASPSAPIASGSTAPQASASAPSGEITRAETLIVKAFRAPDALIGNHYIASSDALVSDGVHQLVKEPLFYFSYQTGEVVPWLAESFEYSADNTAITINLRDGVNDPDYAGGANRVSLTGTRRNYVAIGASSPKDLGRVRPPAPEELP